MSRWIGIVLACVLAACGDSDGGGFDAAPTTARGTIMGFGADSAMTGTVMFTRSGAMVTVNLSVSNVSTRPSGMHGVHIHQTGDCGTNGNNAGDHWNPTTAPHGDFSAQTHYGDLGNMSLSQGSGTLARSEPSRWCIGCGMVATPGDVIGKALIVHANADNFMGPSGNAGTRIGCAAIAGM